MEKPIRLLALFFILIPILSFSQDTLENKHTFVLVHGAWHGSWAWHKVEFMLNKNGHKVYNVNLPGHGTNCRNKAKVKLSHYRNTVVKVIDSIPEKVVLVGHSMGGAVISEVAERRPNKIAKLVYLAGFLLKNGESVIGKAMEDPYSYLGYNIQVQSNAGVVSVERNIDTLRRTFYNTVKDTALIWLSRVLLTDNPLQPVTTPISITDEKYGTVPRYYIKTTEDNAIAPQAQKFMVDAMPCEKIYSIPTDHSPFFSAPKKLAKIFERIGEHEPEPEPRKKSLAKLEVAESPELDFTISSNRLFLEKVPRGAREIQINVYSLQGQLLSQRKCGASVGASVDVGLLNDQPVIVKLRSNGVAVSRKLHYINSY